MNKNIILCADDYGLNPYISHGIRELISLDRLSAVGCIVTFSDFKQQAQAILDLKSTVKIGLHFNFTEGKYLSQSGHSFLSLKTLLLKSHLHLIDFKLLTLELNAQLDMFVDAFGFMPDFIDGHQHVHQFPVVRKALLQVYQLRLKNKQIRCTYPYLSLPGFITKSAILAMSGGIVFKKMLIQSSIPHNEFFSGIYDFNSNYEYGDLFRDWLAMVKPNTLIMCHPGHQDVHNKDSIGAGRENELAYLSSARFLEDWEEFGISR